VLTDLPPLVSMGTQSQETMLLAAAEEALRVRRAAAKSATDIGANAGASAPIRTLLVSAVIGATLAGLIGLIARIKP
jgi:hypothetical protein